MALKSRGQLDSALRAMAGGHSGMGWGWPWGSYRSFPALTILWFPPPCFVAHNSGSYLSPGNIFFCSFSFFFFLWQHSHVWQRKTEASVYTTWVRYLYATLAHLLQIHSSIITRVRKTDESLRKDECSLNAAILQDRKIRIRWQK